MQRFHIVSLAILVAFFLGMGNGFTQEHPEHPEHPAHRGAEHPGSSQKITKDRLAQAIEQYVQEEAKLKGGYFLFYDAQEKKPLLLTLDRVHKERLAQISDDVYFACADFASADGHTYDLDIFMKGPDAEHLMVTQITLHKKDGKARYTWKKVGNFWKRVPVK